MRNLRNPEFVVLVLFGLIGLLLTLVVLSGCAPNGCPVPAYSVGDQVVFDDVFIGTVLEVGIVDCGEFHYKLKLNVDIDGEPWIVEEITEDHLKPYEPSV